MFHDIPDEVIARMRVLEVLDAEQRQLNVATHERLCAVPPETGRFLAILAAAAPRGEMIEIGTSGGYSTLWLTRAALVRKQRVQSFEIAPAKLAIARDTFAKAGVIDLVQITQGDVRGFLADHGGVAFCFMDHEKTQYLECYEALLPNLVKGGIVAADNIESHAEVLMPFLAHVMADPRVDAQVIPIGKGVLVARRS
ncbi:MAG: O-methyltransferase [Gallionellaceae bacterium]